MTAVPETPSWCRATLSKDFPSPGPDEVSLTLAEVRDKPLPAFAGPLPVAIHRRLEAKGVGLRSGVLVTEVDERGLVLEDGGGHWRDQSHLGGRCPSVPPGR